MTTSDSLEELLHYHFLNTSLLEKALTHRSFLNESEVLESNERLEFLGDAVLELIISQYLYENRPKDQEGILTAARSAIVRTETLAQVASTLRLGEFLKMSKGEEKTGGRTNISLLANTTESIIGALYLDGGIKVAQNFIAQHLLPLAQSIIEGNNFKDAKSLLQEKVQELGFSSPIYKTISESGPDHNKIFKVAVFIENQQLSEGLGRNKQTAQQEAAKLALLVYTQKLAVKAKN